MASPFGKARSPFADMGSSNGLRRFGSERETPFPLPAGQKSFGFGNVAPFAAVTGKESKPKNPFQQSKPFDDGSSGGSILGHASPSPFSFGISSSSFERTGGNQERQKNPFQQPTPLAWGKSRTTAHSSTVQLGNASTSSPLSTGEASPFAFIRKEHEEKNPLQQSKALGGTSKNSQPTTGSLILGHASTSAFSSEKSSPFASTSNDHELNNPFKRSTFLIGASGPSQTMAGRNSSFSFEKSSRFGNVHKPEPKNPSQNSILDGNRSTWSQKEVGSSIFGGASPFMATPFGQPAMCSQKEVGSSMIGGASPLAASFGQPAMRSQNPLLPFASGSGSQSAGPSPSFHPFGTVLSREGSSIFPPSGYENAECMEEDTLISLSATPSYENTSPEELRWKDYQAKQAAASQMTFNMAPSSPFIVPNRCNGDAAPSNSQVFTSNSADRSTPVFKFCNNGGSLAPSLAMPSAGLNSWSLSTIEGTPNTTASLLESPSPFFNPLFKATPARSPSNPALPFFGSQSQSQLVPQSPFAALDLSSGVSSISTMRCPLQASSDVKSQSEKASYLEWPQSSLQAPILSMPSPLITIISSPSNATIDQNIFPQRELALAAAAENSSEVTSGMPFKFSNTESGSLVRHGISSLPDAGKYSHPRTISLLTSKQVFQKTVIRMQSRRQGSLKKDGPRVSFLNDYSDPEDSGNRDASCVARKNPKDFLLRAPWLNNRATQIGALKDDSIKAV